MTMGWSVGCALEGFRYVAAHRPGAKRGRLPTHSVLEPDRRLTERSPGNPRRSPTDGRSPANINLGDRVPAAPRSDGAGAAERCAR
jgi:hypothetical protein